MPGDRANEKTWSVKGRLSAVRDAQIKKLAHARQLLSQKSLAFDAVTGPARPPVDLPDPRKWHSALRYRRTIQGEKEFTSSPVGAALDAIATSIKDHRDRVILAWPNRPDNGFVLAALHLLEGRLGGEHSIRSLGLWPWRGGITRTSNSILVNPGPLIRFAQQALAANPDATLPPKCKFGGDAYEMVHLRLAELAQTSTKAGSSATVRLPSLLELTSFFPPNAASPFYLPNPQQILQRVRKHTNIDAKKGLTTRHVEILGDPSQAPVCIFGLPTKGEPSLSKFLKFSRFKEDPLAAVIIDLTRTSLNFLGESWEDELDELFKGLDLLGSSRPPVVALVEDVFTYKKSETYFRKASVSCHPKRHAPQSVGLMLTDEGFLGEPTAETTSLKTFTVRADLKEARLISLRNDVLGEARRIEKNGDSVSATALRAGLSYVRKAASLPIGFEEAREVVEIIYDGLDPEDRARREQYYPATALSSMTSAAAGSSFSETLTRYRNIFQTLVEGWSGATPVSEKLRNLAKSGSYKQLVVLSDQRLVDLYNLSEAAQAAPWRVSDVNLMAQTATAFNLDHWIVVSPSNDTIRKLLTVEPGPSKLYIIGDAAGLSLLEAELKPIGSLAAFSVLHSRVKEFRQALGSSASNPALDYEEISAPVIKRSRALDFSQSGDSYNGPLVRLITERGYTLIYRPGSEVLRHIPDDIRAFEKVDAEAISEKDAVLVLTERLTDLLRHALARTPKTVETLRDYHGYVGRERAILPGNTLTDKARLVVQRIKAKHPEFAESELQNVKRWLDVDAVTLDDPSAQPQAPRDRHRLGLFLGALGADKMLQDAWWEYGIRLTRSYRLSEGMLFNQRAVGFVLDPESFSAVNAKLNVEPLRMSLLENTDVVTKIEVANAYAR